MPVSFAQINAREYRHRCFIFDQLRELAKSKPGSKIKGLKKAVDGGYCRTEKPPANDPTIVFPVAHRMDTSGASAKVRYTTLFSFNSGFYLFQADPIASKKSTGYMIATCVKLTAQQYANFISSFARDAGEQFGFQDAHMNAVAAANQSPVPNNDHESIPNLAQGMMPVVITPLSEYGSTPKQVWHQNVMPPGSNNFAQAVAQVEGQAEEIYQ